MDDTVFYENLIKLCNMNEITPSAVAHEVGLTSAAVTKWKNGSIPRKTTAQKIADYFGVSYNSLIETQVFVANTDFYKNFIRLCNKADETPSSVVDTIGVHRSLLTRWKNGSVPRSTTIRKIADHFGVSTEELLRPEYVKTPIGKLELAPQDINAIANILADKSGMRNVAEATEDQWRVQLDRCSIEKLFAIQETLTSVIREKATKNASPETDI